MANYEEPRVPNGPERRFEPDELRGESVGGLMRDFFAEAQHLVRGEVALAKAEVRAEARRAGKASGMVGGGGVLAHAGLLTLVGAAVALLATLMSLWVAALIVGVLALLVGGLIAQSGLAKMKALNPKPDETMETLEEDREWAKRTMRAARSRRRANA